jgi:hypothetical protein
LGVAGGRLGEGQLVGGGLLVVAQEGGVVAVARGVDADADADSRADGRLRDGDLLQYHGASGTVVKGDTAAGVLRGMSGAGETCDKRS